MNLLVTGGSGFLGKRVLDVAARRGVHVVALARSEAAADVVRRHGATVLPGDLDDVESLTAAFRGAGCDALLNVASLGFGHAEGIVSATVSAEIERAVFVSTTAVTTTLNAPSKKTRLAAEDSIRNSPLNWTIVRPTMIYGGSDDRNIARLLQVLRRSPVLPVPGGGGGLQQPVHVDDLAETLVSAVTAPGTSGATYDVAGQDVLSFRDLVRTARAAVRSRTVLVPVPLVPVIAAAQVYGRVTSSPRISAEQFQRLAEDKVFSNDAAARDLGHRPRTFADGLRHS